MKATVMFGMETREIEVKPDGTVEVTRFTDMGRADGGTYKTVDSFLDDMFELGYGRQCRAALQKIGVV